jgi:peptidoglycan/LPS O-acetylase OafA/YrhL
MKAVRFTATVATALMSLMNLPFAFHDGGAGIPKPVAWLVTIVGVAGVVAAVALLRNARWAGWAVTAVGALNLAGAVLALVRDQDGAFVSLVLSVAITLLGAVCLRDERNPR